MARFFVVQTHTGHVPVLLCTTKLAQGTSQYYSVLRSLRKARPSTTLSYKACTKHDATMHSSTRHCSSKTGSGRQSRKKHHFEGFLLRLLIGKSQGPKCRKLTAKSQSRPSCSHSNEIYDVQLQKTIVLRTQPWHQETLTQPLQCVLQPHGANSHLSTHLATQHGNIHAAIPLRSATRNSTTA